MFAMMLAVEWPDRAADAAGGKRNLLVRRGPAAAGRLATRQPLCDPAADPATPHASWCRSPLA